MAGEGPAAVGEGPAPDDRAEGDVPLEAVRFVVKLDRITLATLQLAQYGLDLAEDIEAMAGAAGAGASATQGAGGSASVGGELAEALGPVAGRGSGSGEGGGGAATADPRDLRHRIRDVEQAIHRIELGLDRDLDVGRALEVAGDTAAGSAALLRTALRVLETLDRDVGGEG